MDKVSPRVAVIIPCFRVKKFILSVIAAIPATVDKIFVVDDACPERSGAYVQEHCTDPRVEVLFNPVNLGVGGAMLHGYRRAMEDAFFIAVKLDGDGQMNASQIDRFVTPIKSGLADYTKGNRFYHSGSAHAMPLFRRVCNMALSPITKLSSGYWNSHDPTNGFTAISVAVLHRLPLARISNDYFFESDLLFRLHRARAVLMDIPIDAIYGDEQSNLKLVHNAWPFVKGNMANFVKRIALDYVADGFSTASAQLACGLICLPASMGCLATFHRNGNRHTGVLATLLFWAGIYLLLSFLKHDRQSIPMQPLTASLPVIAKEHGVYGVGRQGNIIAPQVHHTRKNGLAAPAGSNEGGENR